MFFGRCQLLGAMPEQYLVNAVNRVIGVGLEHIVQPGLGGDAIQLRDPGQRVDHGGAGEQVVAAAGSTGNPPKLKQLSLQRGGSRCRAGR